MHHEAVARLDALLDVEDMARAHQPRRQRRNLERASGIEDEAAVGACAFDRIEPRAAAAVVAPLHELVERELVIDLVAKGAVAMDRRHPRLPLRYKVYRLGRRSKYEHSRVEPRSAGRAWVVAAPSNGVGSEGAIVVLWHMEAVCGSHKISLGKRLQQCMRPGKPCAVDVRDDDIAIGAQQPLDQLGLGRAIGAEARELKPKVVVGPIQRGRVPIGHE
eukprot:5293737-Prymnesium_polylepis.2